MDYNIGHILRDWFTGVYFHYSSNMISSYMTEILLHGRPVLKQEPDSMIIMTWSNMVNTFTLSEYFLCLLFVIVFGGSIYATCSIGSGDGSQRKPDTIMDHLYDSINEIETLHPDMSDAGE
jgi:hypothetical protein